MTRIALACDHAGYKLKVVVAARLKEAGYGAIDCGCHSSERVDYADFTLDAALHVLDGEADFAFFACGNGYAMAMLANRLPGMRAAVCHDIFTARTVREMGDSNAIAIGARVIAPEHAWDIARAFLTSRFLGDTEIRYRRRLERLNAIEQVVARPDWRERLVDRLASTTSGASEILTERTRSLSPPK